MIAPVPISEMLRISRRLGCARTHARISPDSSLRCAAEGPASLAHVARRPHCLLYFTNTPSAFVLAKRLALGQYRTVTE
jgi:hypothetical protein